VTCVSPHLPPYLSASSPEEHGRTGAAHPHNFNLEDIMTKKSMHCGQCGGEDIMRDAWATWDVTSQTWVLGEVFDYAFCADCEADATVVERFLDPLPETASCA
jgi:hypothetical protein